MPIHFVIPQSSLPQPPRRPEDLSFWILRSFSGVFPSPRSDGLFSGRAEKKKREEKLPIGNQIGTGQEGKGTKKKRERDSLPFPAQLVLSISDEGREGGSREKVFEEEREVGLSVGPSVCRGLGEIGEWQGSKGRGRRRSSKRVEGGMATHTR